VFENRVLRKIFGLRKDEVTGEWKGLHKGKFYDLVLLTKQIGHQIKNEMAGSCGTYGRRMRGIQCFYGESRGKDTT
jgi:hypothetical protein